MATPGPPSPLTFTDGKRRASVHISTTPFAKKYGPVTGSWLLNDSRFTIVDDLAPQGRSGITPTLPPSIISPAGSSPGFRARTLNAVASNQDKEIDRLQRYEFFGFTSRELVDHGMFPDLNAKRADEVVGPILDLLKINNVWESLDKPPATGAWVPFTRPDEAPWYDHLPQDIEWRAQVPVIEEMLDPILRLASRFLTEEHTNTVLRALCKGEIREQPPEKWRREGPSGKKAWSFHSQPPRDGGIDPDELFAFMCKDDWLSIGFYDEDYPYDPDISDKGDDANIGGITWCEYTMIEEKVTKVHIVLNVSDYQPLLRDDLSISERLAAEFHCAATIAHEVLHASFASIIEYYDKAGGVPFPIDRADGEPYFETEGIAEIGFAQDNFILDGISASFLLGRFDHIDKRRDYPRLVYYVETWPSGGRGSLEHTLDDFKIPTENRIRPIPATYYQSIQDHEFWELIVRKYGVEVVHPPSVVHVIDDGSGNFDPGPDLVVNVKTSRWEKDWPEPTDDPSETIQRLANKTKAQSDLYKVQLQLKIERLRIEERARFRNGRWAFASQSRRLWEIVDSSWGVDPEVETSRKLHELLELIVEEAEKHIKEISTFKLRNDQDLNHLEFLKELNHHMRRMAIKVRWETSDIKDDTMSIQAEANDLVNKLNICLVMLHDQGRTSLMNFNSTNFYNLIKLEATPAAIKALVAADLYAQIDPDRRDELLQEGEDAIKAKDEAECKRIAMDLAYSYVHIPFFGAVVCLLLSHNSDPEYKNILDRLSPGQSASLMKPNKVCSEDIRKRWLDIWTSQVAPSSSTSAGGKKRRRNDLHEDDTEGEAEKNRLFIKRFRHDDPGNPPST